MCLKNNPKKNCVVSDTWQRRLCTSTGKNDFPDLADKINQRAPRQRQEKHTLIFGRSQEKSIH